VGSNPPPPTHRHTMITLIVSYVRDLSVY